MATKKLYDQRLEKDLLAGLGLMELSLNDEQISNLLAYIRLLDKWNSRYNLSGITDLGQMVGLHLLDSLAIVRFVESAEVVLDVGSGAGLPGIPLAIACPQTRFVLLDSNGKKTRFLFQAKITLGLSNIEIENCRVEHYQSKHQIDMVVCRAFSSIADVLAKTRSLQSENFTLLAMKGSYPHHEIEELPKDFELADAVALEVPGVGASRQLIKVQKSKKAKQDQ